MKEETKRLFAAPWEVCLEKRGSFYRPCVCSSDTKIASVCTKENANRLTHLPELYDALEQAVKRCCSSADDRCPKQGAVIWTHCRKCTILPWLELLRKVRNGE